MAEDVFPRLLYGEHILARNPLGDLTSVEALTIQDLQAYYKRAFVPSWQRSTRPARSSLEEIRRSLQGMVEPLDRWSGRPFHGPGLGRDRAGLYFLDMPGSAQSVVTSASWR